MTHVDLPVVLAQNSQFVAAVERLGGITGFVTVVCASDDLRPTVFNRRDHIARVDATARIIVDEFVPTASWDLVHQVVWLHDLNRWPFAHNLEKGRYSQASDVMRFLLDRGVTPDSAIEDAIATVHEWRIGVESTHALVGLAADKVAGMVEDLLFAVCGLNVRPDYFPVEGWQMIGMDPGARHGSLALEQVSRDLHASRDLEAFAEGFSRIFVEAVRHLLSRSSVASVDDPTGLRACVTQVRNMRRELVAPRIFPINNELVCRRSHLEASVFAPLFSGDKAPSVDELLGLDDATAASRWSTGDGLDSLRQFVPDLDVIARTRPELAFLGGTYL